MTNTGYGQDKPERRSGAGALPATVGYSELARALTAEV